VTATGSAGPPTKPACPAALSNPPARATPVPTIAPSASGGSSTVFDWGGSSSGALGDQSTSDAARNPVRVSLPGGTTVSALAAGDDFAMALTTTGSVLAWGDDEWGELGDGATTDSEFPVLVDLPEGTVATAIAAGNGFALALTSTGAIYSWGINFFGNLGDGTSAQSDLPVPVSQLDSGMRATAIAAGGYHALALIAGQPNCVFAWGDDRLGEGGAPDPTPNDGTSGYVCVPQGTDLTTVAAGGDFSLAVSSTGSVYSWGDNRDGELGDAVGDGSTTAVLVDLPTGTQVTAVAAGLNHALALTSAGTLFAWGDNVSGDLGDGTTTKRDVPVAVRLPAGARVADIAAYDWSSLAVTSGGSILSWGMAEDTGTVDVPAPVATPGGTRVSRVAVGSDFSIATA
ncbi:MAG: hypothetical protein ABR950_11215, partial [Candidatus Dormibacteria bacterium]